MDIISLEILLVAIVTAVACALPGVFLVLRRQAMLSDAISHTVLLGIVLAFFLVRDLSSPVLILGAAAVGVLTVMLVGLLERTQLVRSDAAIGLVFPALFSLAVILITLYAGDVHLDTDMVLLGEIALTPFDRLSIAGLDLGPRGFYVMAGILAINLVVILLFYKELKIATFDAALAAALGFLPAVLHYGLMSLVSVTVVSAFDIVGSVLVVALMVAPPATAYLLTDRLPRMLLISAGAGALSAVIGYWVAFALDASISGAMAGAAGLLFALAFLFSPQRGLVVQWRRRRHQKIEFAVTLLASHLANHEHEHDAALESSLDHLHEHLNWDAEFASRVLQVATSEGTVQQEGQRLSLTDAGRQRAQSVG